LEARLAEFGKEYAIHPYTVVGSAKSKREPGTGREREEATGT